MKKSTKSDKSKPSHFKPTRKQLRKQQRKAKKERRHEYHTNRKNPGQYVLTPDKNQKENGNNQDTNAAKAKHSKQVISESNLEKSMQKEKKELQNLQKQMQKQRTKQMKQANEEEDRNIRHLEKQLKLHKRKSKSIPKSFASDGLDYLLEVCDSEKISEAVNAEKQLLEASDGFEEDFDLMMGKSKNLRKDSDESDSESDFDSEDEEMESDFDSENEEMRSDFENDSDVLGGDLNGKNVSEGGESEEDVVGEKDKRKVQKNLKKVEGKGKKTITNKQKDLSDSEDEKVEKSVQTKDKKRRNLEKSDTSAKDENKKKKMKLEEDVDDFDDEETSEEDEDKSDSSVTKDGTWEDIYGRLRGEDGSVIETHTEKYVPPAIRAKMQASSPADKKRSEALDRLKKQLKGLLNRLAESNMHSIANQIEELYMKNSRNDMNENLTDLILEAVVGPVLTPERLVIEHATLVTVLHANVGIEVGAHFLQTAVKKFDEIYNSKSKCENKMLDNLLLTIAHLYNFKLFHSQLLYHIMQKLTESFDEKDVECILRILKSVGFTLRKDDPLALKDFILNVGKKAADIPEDTKKDNSRIKFMLDILLAIKNNNVTKIPNYDTSYSEHMKKLLKGFVRKGNYVTQLNISLEDLLKADERGKWWVVGSAWSGNTTEHNVNNDKSIKWDRFSEKILEAARKQRMNTDTRRIIFCSIASAKDYLDAFVKLMRLDQKDQQPREIMPIILHCCMKETTFNPFYAYLTQKLCEHDRKFQMALRCSTWDKLKALQKCSGFQIANLAKLLIHLFLEKAISITTLKVVQFNELDEVSLRFIRQILLGILLHDDLEACMRVFEKLPLSENLKMFRESLRLFIQIFLLKNLKDGAVPEDKKNLLKERAQMVEKLLTRKARW